MEPDHHTVAAAQSGDAAAFDSLFARHLPALQAFLRHHVNGEVAARESVRDLAQSVCREVLQDLDAMPDANDEGFRGWLFLQATRKIVDRYRYHKRARRDVAREAAGDLDTGAEPALASPSPSHFAAGREELSRIEDGIHALPPRQRMAVILSRLEGMTYDEIAHQMDTTESSVRGLVARGLASLAELLED